jgi:hypothetical protein
VERCTSGPVGVLVPLLLVEDWSRGDCRIIGFPSLLDPIECRALGSEIRAGTGQDPPEEVKGAEEVAHCLGAVGDSIAGDSVGEVPVLGKNPDFLEGAKLPLLRFTPRPLGWGGVE